MEKSKKEERLEKVEAQITSLSAQIDSIKEKLKQLNATKKKIKEQIEKEKTAALSEVLKSYGITSVEDFEVLIDKLGNSPQPTEE